MTSATCNSSPHHIWTRVKQAATPIGVGRGVEVAKAPLDFEIFSKKGCLFSFEWKKENFTTFGSALEKF